MPIEGLDHVYVETRHYDHALRFWAALGFVVGHSWGEEGHRACQMTCGAACVVLAESAPSTMPVRPTMHFALSEAQAMDRALADADGVEIVTPLEKTHWGTRWIRVRDPDGHLWVLEAPRKD